MQGVVFSVHMGTGEGRTCDAFSVFSVDCTFNFPSCFNYLSLKIQKCRHCTIAVH